MEPLFIILTSSSKEKEKVRLNVNSIQYYTQSPRKEANSFVQMGNGVLLVDETPDEIDNLISPPKRKGGIRVI